MDKGQIEAWTYVVGGAIAAIVAVVHSYLQKSKQGPQQKSDPRKRIDPRLCAYIKKNGEQCQHEPKRGSRYCALHSRKELMRRIESEPRQRRYVID